MDGGTNTGARKAKAVFLGCVLLVGLTGPFSADAAISPNKPLTEGEVRDFLAQADWAMHSCDAKWLESHLMPDFQYSYSQDGALPVVVDVREILDNFRDTCLYTRTAYDKNRASLSINSSQAVWSAHGERGTQSAFIFFDVSQIDRFDSEWTIVRDESGALKVKEIYEQYFLPAPKPSGTEAVENILLQREKVKDAANP